MFRHLVLCVMVAVTASGRGIAAKPEAGSRWAVLVGVDDYAKLRPLRHAVSDMRALADQLVAGGFERDHVYVLADKAEKAALLPSKRNIEERLDLVLSLVKPNDLVVVGFAGHGVEVGGKPYWCPTEAVVDGDDADVAQTLVPLESVYAKLAGCQAALRLIVVDACRDDPRRTRSGVPMKLDLVAQALTNPPEGILVLNSCGSGEKSQEDAKLGHGVFTHFLMDGLNGGADADGDGSVSLGEWFEHAGARTKKYVADELATYQSPKLSGEVSPGVLRFPIAAARRAGTVTENSIGMKLAFIPPGEFDMGSEDGEDDEQPVHRVRITRPFLMGQTEVTQEQWKRVMGTTPWKGEQLVKQAPNVAASYVSWDDAVGFCRKITEIERKAGRLPVGRLYRLPTEAEWEYACRAGTTTRWSFGDDAQLIADHCWLDGMDDFVNGATAPYAHEVGGKKPNPWGLFDMHGNAWEWCADWLGDYAAGLATDPVGPGTGSFRVLRGGGWGLFSDECRSAIRHDEPPAARINVVGFRVVCELE